MFNIWRLKKAESAREPGKPVSNEGFLSRRLYSNQQQLTQIHIRTSNWPTMLFPWRLSKVIMRSRIQSVHQMTIIHSDIGHCWRAITGLYLLPAPFNISYIAPVFYDREDRRTITEGERYFSAGSLAELPFFSLSEFSSEEIETFHLGETGAIKVRLLWSVP